MTDSLLVEVKMFRLIIETKNIKDITPVKSSLGDWWKYLLLLAVILGIGALVYWFVKKTTKEKIEEEYIKHY
jgi:ABC-type uncharacterized transport system permease subunit